jgi:hypothetical protein
LKVVLERLLLLHFARFVGSFVQTPNSKYCNQDWYRQSG